MKRTTIILALSFLSFFAPAMAEAVPFKVSFAATVPGTPGEPLLGMPVSGFFIYDDPFHGDGARGSRSSSGLTSRSPQLCWGP